MMVFLVVACVVVWERKEACGLGGGVAGCRSGGPNTN